MRKNRIGVWFLPKNALKDVFCTKSIFYFNNSSVSRATEKLLRRGGCAPSFFVLRMKSIATRYELVSEQSLE